MTLQELEEQSGGIVKQKKYLKKNPLRRYLIQRYLNCISELAELVPASTGLDVGCGEGFVIEHLGHRLPKLKLLGIDIEKEVLKVAAYQNPNAGFAVALANKLPFTSNGFDLIMCNEVLEHLENPTQTLDETARVGNGHFIFSVPQEPYYRLANLAIGANWSRWGDDIDHCQRWTRTQFVKFLNRKFDIVRVRAPFPWVMVLCQLRSSDSRPEV